VGVRWAIFDYFGTFTRSMLSMFEITLGNWIPITRLLVDNVSEWYMGGFICYKVTVSFAVVKVITGVFMHETFKVASGDDDLMIVNQARLVAKHKRKMHALMAECDESGDGNLDRDEFRSVMRDPRVKTWLSAMELNVSDPDALFNLLDNDPAAPGIITADELAGGVSRLKGTARSLDMAQLREEMKRVAEKIDFIVSTTSNAPRSQTESASASSALSSQEPQVLLSSIGRALAPVEYSLNELLHEIRGAVIGSGSVGPSSRTQQTDNKPPGLLSRRPPVSNGLQACPRLDMGTTREISNDMVADRLGSHAANALVDVSRSNRETPRAYDAHERSDARHHGALPKGHNAALHSVDAAPPRGRLLQPGGEHHTTPAPDHWWAPPPTGDALQSNGEKSRPGFNPSDVSVRLKPGLVRSASASRIGSAVLTSATAAPRVYT